MIFSLLLSLSLVAQDGETARAERAELAELQPEINVAIDDGVAYLLRSHK